MNGLNLSVANTSLCRSLSIAFSLLILTVLGLAPALHAQTKILADEVTHTSGNDKITLIGPRPTVLNAANALTNDETYATLLASPGVAVGLGSYVGVIELSFENELPANTWSFVRMDGQANLFKTLLGGNLGSALANLLGAIALGGQEVDVEARTALGTVVATYESSDGFSGDRVKLFVDAAGNYVLGIRPHLAYQRIRITNSTVSALGLGIERELKVYNAYYYSGGGAECGRPIFTSFDGDSGLGLTVADFDDQYLERAIDSDVNSYSMLKSSSALDL